MSGMVGLSLVHTDYYAFTLLDHDRGQFNAFLALFQHVTQQVEWWVTQHVPTEQATCFLALTVFSKSWFTRP
jgi:hypothetical protein